MHFEVSAKVPTVARSETGPPVLDARQLSAWYAHRQAIDWITLQICRSADHGDYRPVRFGQEHAIALPQSTSRDG